MSLQDRFAPERLIAAACEEAGSDDFGAEGWRPGLHRLTDGLINDARFAEYLVSTGKCDMVAIGRGLVENPRWPWDAAKVLEASVPHPKQYMRGEKPVWRYSSLAKK